MRDHRTFNPGKIAGMMSLALMTATAHAAEFDLSGTIHEIHVHNVSSFTDNTFNDWITLEGVASAGTCSHPSTADNLVVMKLPSRTTDEYKTMMSLLHGAMLAGKVAVSGLVIP